MATLIEYLDSIAIMVVKIKQDVEKGQYAEAAELLGVVQSDLDDAQGLVEKEIRDAR
jgi:hypothetical protein